MTLVGFAVLFILTFFGLGAFRRFAEGRNLLFDVPNDRSSHSQATVRGAGLVFVVTACLAWGVLAMYSASSYLLPLVAAGLTVASVSFVDDIKGLPISTRLCGQLVAALLFLSAVPLPSFLREQLGVIAWLWTPIAAFFMVAVINIYNFMDGIDGLCTLHSLCVLVSWIVFSSAADLVTNETLMCMCVGFPLLAFLVHNWSPARIFMGDVGSTFLGFTFAALAVIQAPGIFRSTNFLTLIMLMMPFLFDATFTLVVRFLRGERWYLPHTSHLFQRLVRSGLSHAFVASLYGVLTLYMGCLVALLNRGLFFPGQAILPLLVLPYLGMYFWVVHREQRQTSSAQATDNAPAH